MAQAMIPFYVALWGGPLCGAAVWTSVAVIAAGLSLAMLVGDAGIYLRRFDRNRLCIGRQRPQNGDRTASQRVLGADCELRFIGLRVGGIQQPLPLRNRVERRKFERNVDLLIAVEQNQQRVAINRLAMLVHIDMIAVQLDAQARTNGACQPSSVISLPLGSSQRISGIAEPSSFSP